MNRLYGAHVSTAGGFHHGIANGRTLEVNAIQVHPSPPQRWNKAPYPADYELQFNQTRPTSGIERVFFHGIYLINLASRNEELLELSRNSLAYYLDLCSRIHGDGVIFHVGSVTDGASEEEGCRRAADQINRVLELSSNSARLLLEVAAGAGTILGDRMEELAAIREMVEQKERVFFALDSQHLWASGYDLVNDLDQVVEDADATLGIENIHAFHLNDSKTPLGSRKDRHENLGEGLMGRAAIERLVRHPRLVQIPFILETPALKTLDTAAGEVRALRALMGM